MSDYCPIHSPSIQVPASVQAGRYIRLYGDRAVAEATEREVCTVYREAVIDTIQTVRHAVDAAVDAAIATQPKLPPCPCEHCAGRR